MTDLDAGIFILKVDALASGTMLRVGRHRADLSPVEDLCVGDEVYDPIEERLVEITDISCITLDSDTIRQRGLSPKLMAGGALNAALVYGVKVPTMLARNGYTPPIRGEFALSEGTVFYTLCFERRTIVETSVALCEFARPTMHAFETASRRTPSVLPAEAAMRAW